MAHRWKKTAPTQHDRMWPGDLQTCIALNGWMHMERRCLLTMIRNYFVAENSDGRTVKANILESYHEFLYTGKGKGKVHPITGHEDPEGE